MIDDTPDQDIEKGRWRLEAGAGELFERLRGAGKVMLVLRGNGATHERIGPIEAVSTDAAGISVAGGAHTALIDPGKVTEAVLDTSSGFQGRIFPSLTFNRADGAPVIRVVSMEGAPGFLAGLEAVARSTLPAEEGPARGQQGGGEAESLETDPGFTLLEQMRAEGRPVEICHRMPGSTQSWEGVIAEVKPAMGFANVMTENFHLHLKAGAVSDWEERDGGFHALGPDGEATGLSVMPKGTA
ncbi:hypothetical protein [Vannielia sp. SX4]|uniref:hypothetical protein n=1 Tax=Vannielia sp. SX4 TaxID=3463852 RepID=UPI004057CC90